MKEVNSQMLNRNSHISDYSQRRTRLWGKIFIQELYMRPT